MEERVDGARDVHLGAEAVEWVVRRVLLGAVVAAAAAAAAVRFELVAGEVAAEADARRAEA
jgi:hypothetical protein